MNISIATYAQAMRIAVKYSMDDVQVAIAGVIQIISPQPPRDLGTAILRLAFVAEFPSHFFQDVAVEVFTHASSIKYQPTAADLRPLMPYPAFVALMMRYREGLSKSNTSRKCEQTVPSWLHTEFRNFGLKPNPKRQVTTDDWEEDEY